MKTLISNALIKLYVKALSPNFLLVLLGSSLLVLGLSDYNTSIAQSFASSVDESPGLGVAEGDERIFEVSNRLFELIEGNFGSLIMIAAGLGAIISAAFGAYRAAVGMLVVAVGAFILRSLVVIFFTFE